MRILVISDIHSNITALDAVLGSTVLVDGVWCLGDLVGYGPDPNECIDRIRNLPNLICLLGNHDAAVSGRRNADKFNDDAQEAILITRSLISADNLDFLKSLPETAEAATTTLAHGSPRNPIWEYVVDVMTARMNFAFFKSKLAMVGHTHLPVIFTFDQKNDKVTHKFLKSGEMVHLVQRSILNPGSVGQPRDHDPRASYAIFDPEGNTWEINRVEYDVRSVQKRIKKAGLPEKHALRLSEGW
jgi:predicted phosphodiesterase